MTRTVLPRKSQRRSVAMAVQCRTQGGLRDDAQISDISTEGCCLRLGGIYFRVGTRLLVKPKGMETMSGVVRWVTRDLAGVEFDRPIYGPVLEHIASVYGPSAAS